MTLWVNQPLCGSIWGCLEHISFLGTTGAVLFTTRRSEVQLGHLNPKTHMHESSFTWGTLSFLDPSVDHLIDLVEALAQFGVVQNLDRKDLRRGRVVRFGCRCECKTGRWRSPAWSPGNGRVPGDPLDQACASASAPQVISHLARGHVVRAFTQQGSPMVAQVAVGKTPRQETEHQHGA